MSEINTELVSRLVTGRKRDGRCTYDPEAKAEIVRACMQPGVSVARIAMQFGINPNLVRTWIGKRRGTELARPIEPASRLDGVAAFVPLQIEAAKADPVRPPVAMLRLNVRLPNGVEFDLGEASLDDLSPVIRILGGMPCSGSTSR
ncbi:MAG: IS66 family insertion sequence hypothetical protein [Variovorax sp.]|nr:MAG: IS66 family insertion sequence hypothetical protein [Variovorax sp.]